MIDISKLKENTAYTISGYIEGSGYKFKIRSCYIIDGELYRPVVADYSGDGIEYRQPEEDEIGWDYIPFQDGVVIESAEKQETK